MVTPIGEVWMVTLIGEVWMVTPIGEGGAEDYFFIYQGGADKNVYLNVFPSYQPFFRIKFELICEYIGLD